ncbi:MAG: SPOR domain-containing protein, partial [Bacteroidia bacterium]|nr:SPOR domain-containing protein [Bacteroidia bacterium]
MTSRRKVSKRFIIPFLLLIFFVTSTLHPCRAEKYYTVQVAASKTPIDIGQFIKKNNIEVEITEIKGSDWIRYFAGHFDNYDSASVFAAKLLRETRLTNIYIRQIEDTTGHRWQDGLKAVAEQSTKSTPGTVPDTLQLNTVFTQQEENRTDTLLVDRINTEQNSNITQPVSQKSGRKSLPNQLFDYVNNKVIGDIQQFLKGDGEKIYGYPLVIYFFLF